VTGNKYSVASNGWRRKLPHYDTGYLNQIKFSQLLAQAEEVARIVGGLRVSVEKQRGQSKQRDED